MLKPWVGGEGLSYERSGDARHLSLECKLRILISLKVSAIFSLNIKVSVRVALKEIENAVILCWSVQTDQA